MKKLFLLLAALLPGLLAHSQEADRRGPYAEATFVARAEYSTQEYGHHLGNSSIYAFVDGGFTERLSFSVATHLLNSEPGDLYKYTLHSDVANWLDWAYLAYDFGKFQFSLGKNYIVAGTFEFDEYDCDLHYELASVYWMNMNTYQWGGKLTWSPVDNFRLSAHVSTSPFGERPFSSGLYSYTIGGGGEVGCYNGLFSFNFHQREGMTFMKMLNMGHRVNLGNWQLTWDSNYDFSAKKVPMSQLFYVTYNLGDHWTFTGKASLHTVGTDEDNWLERAGTDWFGGLVVNWTPIKMIRVHALASYDSITDKPSFNIGVTWKITL